MSNNPRVLLRRIGLILLAWASLLISPPRGSAQAASTLDEVFKNIDAAAKQFKSVTANVERTKVTVVINDRSTESGEMWMRRDGKIRMDMTSPSPRTILIDADHLYIYTPGLKRVDEYDLSKHRAIVQEALLLGFGDSSDKLKNNYAITLQGEDTLDGTKVVRLELVPKSEDERKYISRIELWVDEASWMPVQQQLYETGSQDYSTIHYTNVMRNVTIPDSRFQAHWPPGVTKDKP